MADGDKATGPKNDETEHAQTGIPNPPPHEEQATGTPNDDRLQSEVPHEGGTGT